MSVSQVLKGLNGISPPTSLSVSEHSIFWVNEHSTYISMTNKTVKTHTIKDIKVNAKGARSLKVVHRNIQKGNKLSDYDIMMFWRQIVLGMGTCGRQFPRVARFISILLFPVVTLLANSAQPQQRQKRENNQNKKSERAAHLVTGFFTAFAPQKMSNMIEMAMR